MGTPRPNPKRRPVPPPAAPPNSDGSSTRSIRASDVVVNQEWKNEGGSDEVRVLVTHTPSGSTLAWKGTQVVLLKLFLIFPHATPV